MKSPLAARFASRRSRSARALTASTAVLLPALTFSGILSAPSAQAANVTRTLTTTGNSNLVAAPTAVFTGGSPSAASAGDIFLYNTAATAANLNLDGSITIGAIKTTNTGTLSILAGGGTITLDGTGISGANSTNGVAGVAGIQASATGSNVNIAAPLVLATTTDFAATAAFAAVTATPNISVTGAITTSTAVTLNLRATNSNGNITLSGPIGASGSAIAITTNSSGGGITVLSGTLGAQVASVTASQTNQFTPLYLSGVNTSYAGTTSITTSGGNIFGINTAATNVLQAFGTGGISLAGGTLNLRANGSANTQTIITGSGTTGNNVTVSGNTTISVDRNTTTTGVPGTTGTFTGSTIQLNNLSIGANTLSATAGNNYILQFAGTTTLTGNATFSGTGLLTLSGAVGDGGSAYSITKTGTSTLSLNGPNTFSGGVNLSAGILSLGNATALGPTTGVLVIAGGSLNSSVANLVNSNNNAVTINGDFSFTGTQNLNLGTGAISLGTAAGTTRTITGIANTLTLGGVISNGTTANSLTKVGVGTVALTGNNTYTGATNVATTTAFNTFEANGIPLVVSGAAGTINTTSAVNITGNGILNSPGGSAYLQLDNTAGSLERINDAAAVNLSRGGELRLTQGNSTTGATETVSALNFTGGVGIVTLNGAASVLTQLKATDLNRTNLATGLVRGTNLGAGNTNAGRILLTNAPSGVNFVGSTTASTATGGSDKTLKIVPWLVGDVAVAGGNFGSALVTYDATSGLRPLVTAEQNSLTGPTNAYTTTGENVTLNTAVTLTTTGASNLNSLYVTSAGSSLTGSGGALNIASGTIGGQNTGGSIGGFSVITLGNSEGIVLGDYYLAFTSPVDVTSGGGLTKAGRNTTSLVAANLYTGQTTVNQGLLQLGSGGTTGSLANTTQAIVLNGGSFGTNRSDTFTLANPISGYGGFTKNGIGTTTLTNNNTFVGNLVANNGTLVLDPSAAAGNPASYSVGAGTLAFLNGGTLQFNGKAGATTTQSISNISSGPPSNNGGTNNSGLGIIAVNNNGGTTTTVTAGTITRATNTLILIDQSGGGVLTTSTAASNGLLGSGSILVKDNTGKIDFATNTGANTATAALNAATALPTITGSATTNYKLDGTLALTGATTSNSLRVNSTGAGQSLALGANALTIAGGGLLYVGSDDYSITGTAAIASTATAAAGGSIAVENFGSGKLTVSALLGTSGSTSTGNVNFYGNGSNLIDWNSTSNLTPQSGTQGQTLVSQVTLRLSNAGAVSLTNAAGNAIGTGTIILANGGILELASGNLTRDIGTGAGGLITFTGSGGFSAFGADRSVNFNSAATLTWGRTSGAITTGFLEDGQSLILGSATSNFTLNFTNPINLGSANHIVEVRDGTSTTNVDGSLNGILSSAVGGSLTKTGAGTLALTAANTFNGSTTISAGILSLTNALALQNSALDTTNSVAGTATAGLRTTVTTLTLGGLTGNKDLASVFTTTTGGYSGVTALTLNPGAGTTPSYSGVIADGAAGMTLTKTGAGTQTLTAANTYTGSTNVNAGTLVIAGNQTGNGQIVVSNAAILQFGDGTSLNGSAAGSGTIFVNNTGTVQLNLANGGTISNQVASNPSAVTTLSGANATGTTNTFTSSAYNNFNVTNGTFAVNSTNAGATLAFTGGTAGVDGAIDLKATNLTVGGAGNTLIAGVGSGVYGSGGSVTKNGTGTLIYQANNGYSGTTAINAGTVRVDVAQTNSGTYFVGNGTNATTQGTAASLLLGGGTAGTSGGVNFNRAVTINQGSLGNRTLGGTNTTGTNTFSGVVDMSGNNGSLLDRSITLTAATGGTVSFTGGFIGGGNNNLQNVTKTGGGTVSLDSTGGFFGTTTVNAGTLAANVTNALQNTNSVVVNSTGTLLLGGTGNLDRVNNATGISLAGGTLARGSGASEGSGASVGLGALTLAANSILDFGSGAAGTLTFSGFTPGSFTLTINGYDGSQGQLAGVDGTDERLIFNSSQAANLGSFFFSGVGAGANQIDLGGGYYEIVPVPEPGTVAAGLLALGSLGLSQRRRVRRFLSAKRLMAKAA